MGRSVQHTVYKAEEAKNNISWDLNEDAMRNSEFGKALPSAIQWREDKVYDNYEEAEKAVDAMVDWAYEQIAVLFHETIVNPRTKRQQEYLERAFNLEDELLELENTYYFSDFKSKFRKCKECGSSVNLRVYDRNTCPVCREDLRPKTELNKIARLKERIADYKEKSEPTTQQSKEKSWLVRTAYRV